MRSQDQTIGVGVLINASNAAPAIDFHIVLRPTTEIVSLQKTC